MFKFGAKSNEASDSAKIDMLSGQLDHAVAQAYEDLDRRTAEIDYSAEHPIAKEAYAPELLAEYLVLENKIKELIAAGHSEKRLYNEVVQAFSKDDSMFFTLLNNKLSQNGKETLEDLKIYSIDYFSGLAADVENPQNVVNRFKQVVDSLYDEYARRAEVASLEKARQNIRSFTNE